MVYTESKTIITLNPKVCRGCGLCELACSLTHENECNPSLSRIRVVKDRDNYKFELNLCLQCAVHRCKEACEKGAVKEMANGAYVIDEKLCVGCGSCAEACPFNSNGLVIFPHTSKGIYVKCDLCVGRSKPACVEVCPTEALASKPHEEG